MKKASVFLLILILILSLLPACNHQAESNAGSTKSATENEQNKPLFGDAYCGGWNKCLNSVTINDIDNICRGYEKNNETYMQIWWRS